MKQFDNAIAIVTGGASGFGCALCKKIGQAGGIVIVADINQNAASDVADSICQTGGAAEARYVDVSKAEEVQQLIDDVVQQHGRLDYMFNNAGMGIGGLFEDMNVAHWRQIVDINVMGVLHGTMAAYQQMVRQGSGHIVNTASVAGLVPFATGTAYAATKHAVVGLSTSLREEAREHGIKVTVLCPGYIDTPLLDTMTLIHAENAKFKGQIHHKLLPVDKAATLALKAVARNQDTAVFALNARILWWLQRFTPALMTSISRKFVQDYQAIRDVSRVATSPVVHS